MRSMELNEDNEQLLTAAVVSSFDQIYKPELTGYDSRLLQNREYEYVRV